MITYKTTTDDTLRETVRHGDSRYPFAYYPENLWQFDFHRVDWHWHHELEFMYVSEGSVLCRIGMDTVRLKEGCGLFVNSGILHRFESESSAFIPNIVFSPHLLADPKTLVYSKYISSILHSAAAFQVFEPQTGWQNRILQILQNIFVLQESDEKNELQTISALLQIWDILYRHLDLSAVPSVLPHVSHQQAKLQTMMQYVHDHYSQQITLEDIAASASMSKSGALHIFKSHIHIPPVAYLIQYRLAHAAEQLSTTEKSVSVIAEETGFTNAGYFCRQFRQLYHMTPNEYRKNRSPFLHSSEAVH